MIKLKRVLGGDPFKEYPQLKEIWPDPYRYHAALASRIDSDSGEVFYIKEDGEVIGITGYFIDDECSGSGAFLRWTGIIPARRGNGIGRKALYELARTLHQAYPQREKIIELIPDNEYGATIVQPFFESVGFAPYRVFIPIGEDTDWPVVSFAANILGMKP